MIKKAEKLLVLLLLFGGVFILLTLPDIFFEPQFTELTLIRLYDDVMGRGLGGFALFGTLLLICCFHKKKWWFFKSDSFDFGEFLEQGFLIPVFIGIVFCMSLYSKGNYETADLNAFTKQQLLGEKKVYCYGDIDYVEVYIDKNFNIASPPVIYKVVFYGGDSVTLGANTGAARGADTYISETDIDRKIKSMGIQKRLDKTGMRDILNGPDEKDPGAEEFDTWVRTLFDEMEGV